MTKEKLIKEPLAFNTLYQRFLKNGKLVISDEITLKEYIEAGHFEGAIITYTDHKDGISVETNSLDNVKREDDEDYFYYSTFSGSKKAALRVALYCHSGLIIKTGT